MANILFVMRPKVGEKIYISYRWGNDKLLYPTGQSVSPAFWNAKKHRVRAGALCPTRDIINARLDEIEALTNKWLAIQRANTQVITKENLRAYLDSIINPKTIDTNTLHGYIIDFIERAQNRTGANGAKISDKTYLGYKRAYKYLQEYEATNKIHLDFKNIGVTFYEKYTAFLQSKGLTANTIGREIKVIKIFLNDAKKHGIELSPEYLGGALKVTKEESINIYLTTEELTAIRNIDFSNNKPLEHARDLFLIGCYTGLRFSDFTRLTLDNINNGIISIAQQKTGHVVEIPLHPVVSSILEKYNGVLPPVISNQKFNKHLATIAESKDENGDYIINGKITKVVTRGGIQESTNIERYKLVRSHTARRSFATNLYLSGYPPINIMKITGHKTETAFLKYIKISGEQSAKMLRSHWVQTGEYITTNN